MTLMVVMGNQPGIAFRKYSAFCALAIALSAAPLRAQRSAPPSGGAGRGNPRPTAPAPTGTPPTTQPACNPTTNPNDVFLPTTQPPSRPVIVEDDACLPWDAPDVRGATVSAIRLGVPSKARNDYNKACGAFKKEKLAEAEQHVRDAIQKYPKYVAAWVMLGEVLQDEQKMNEAHDACSQALSVDPTYLPPYLCLSGLLDRENQWDNLLTLSDQYLGLNLVGDRYVYYYRAEAYFHINKLPDAQKNVLQAITIDNEHHQPGFYLLLAQIYGEQGDVVDAAAQIQQLLKFSSNQELKDTARQYLAKLESQKNAK